MECNFQFQFHYKNQLFQQKLWHEYIFKRQTINQLASKYNKGKDWIRNQLSLVKVKVTEIIPQPLVLIADSTFFKRTFGVIVFRAPHLKKNIYWKEIRTETIDSYKEARIILERQGFEFKAIVLDGRPGVREVFKDIPVQMCHFHQKMIVNRYLTTRPKLEASIELREITLALCKTNKEEFTKALNNWYLKWQDFLKEKTIDPETGKWHYTHKRVRSAFRSLKTNLPFLSTYQKYPELNIPNTTNSLDGSFAHLKGLINIHRGIKKELKLKIINEILGK
ncbi:MAG: hypothetical protein UT66_C0037G0017 [candidate division CPR2 bacterium GW2011_GWC1_39_9]|nr:MAG: hypothetical protein UT66_C0037G0017 [candidate division CPR2 bacterium GW2011_GWC1_39_9]